jgi:hypothetical protein
MLDRKKCTSEGSYSPIRIIPSERTRPRHAGSAGEHSVNMIEVASRQLELSAP